MMENVIQVVSGWIFNSDQTQVLIVNNIGGLWSMPNGGVEPGEYLEAAMIREAFEETGLHVKVNRLVAISEAFSQSKNCKYIFFAFLLTPLDKYQSPSIQMPDEISEIRWVDHSELKQYLPWLQYSPWDILEQSTVGFYLSKMP